jgi:hypothetical protein
LNYFSPLKKIKQARAFGKRARARPPPTQALDLSAGARAIKMNGRARYIEEGKKCRARAFLRSY